MISTTGNDKSGPDVLIVEDSPTQAAQIRHLLEKNGFRASVAKNGKEALAAVQKSKPNLIISDIVMPEMDGYELCRQIRGNMKFQNIPVVLVTTLAGPQDVIRGLQCGADSFIRKPYEEKYLLSRINYVLTNHDLRKNEKVQTGLYIELSGEKHFITAERQQILDMLISSYDEAVNLNEQLTRSYDLLTGLYHIAEDLNRCTDENEVADRAIERAIDLPGVRAGWIVVQNGASNYHIAAARGLPPALQAPDALEGECTCRTKLNAGELDSASNMVECERLMHAKGDTGGLRYHASVPLLVGERRLGLMNLASIEGGLFSEDDLKTLNSVGNQVAVALERAKLYEEMEDLVEERTRALRVEIEERKKLTEDLQRANKVKDEFMSVMSHELRTPLNVVLGYTGMVKDGVLGKINPKQEDALAKILLGAKDQLDMVTNILHATALETQKTIVEKEVVSPEELFKELELTYEEVQRNKEVSLVWKYPPDLPVIETDRFKLKQILGNLINNAIKFTEKGKATISARHVRKDGAIEFKVSDTGIGIPSDTLPRIFEKFSQGDSSDTRQYGGVGIGLYVAKKYAELLGGQVQVETRVGKGSAFAVTLPLR